MPDNKLKDNEIIKAQEYCCEEDGCDRSCPLFDKCKSPIKTMEDFIKFDLDLINRLQAELKVSNEALNNSIKLNNRLKTQNKELSETIHNLNIEKDALFDKAEELKVEVEKLNKEIQITKDAYTMLQTKIEIINSKAVKEFAERLKKYIYKGGVHPTVEDEFICDIDNLLKELNGG